MMEVIYTNEEMHTEEVPRVQEVSFSGLLGSHDPVETSRRTSIKFLIVLDLTDSNNHACPNSKVLFVGMCPRCWHDNP